MKTKFILVFVIIAYALISIKNFETEQMKRAEHLALRYNWAIDSATDDAVTMLARNQKRYNLGHVAIDKEKAVETFFRSLELNFGIEQIGEVFVDTTDTDSGDEFFMNYGDDTSRAVDTQFVNTSFKHYLKTYVPCILVVDYDGYYISSLQEYTASDGTKRIDHLFGPKKYFSHVSSDGNMINFSVDDTVTLFEPNTYRYYFGTRSEVADKTSDTLLLDPDLFESVRRSTITNAIQNDLQRVIHEHNELSSMYGMNYIFTLPTVEDDEWNNVIDDVGIITFIQGIPMGTKRYNNYAFAGARVVKKPRYFGNFIDKNGTNVWVYHRENCPLSAGYHEVFSSKEEAAKAGYYPCVECKP